MPASATWLVRCDGRRIVFNDPGAPVLPEAGTPTPPLPSSSLTRLDPQPPGLQDRRGPTPYQRCRLIPLLRTTPEYRSGFSKMERTATLPGPWRRNQTVR